MVLIVVTDAKKPPCLPRAIDLLAFTYHAVSTAFVVGCTKTSLLFYFRQRVCFSLPPFFKFACPFYRYSSSERLEKQTSVVDFK